MKKIDKIINNIPNEIRENTREILNSEDIKSSGNAQDLSAEQIKKIVYNLCFEFLANLNKISIIPINFIDLYKQQEFNHIDTTEFKDILVNINHDLVKYAHDMETKLNEYFEKFAKEKPNNGDFKNDEKTK